jgi:hypothetical protein
VVVAVGGGTRVEMLLIQTSAVVAVRSIEGNAVETKGQVLRPHQTVDRGCRPGQRRRWPTTTNTFIMMSTT